MFAFAVMTSLSTQLEDHDRWWVVVSQVDLGTPPAASAAKRSSIMHAVEDVRI